MTTYPISRTALMVRAAIVVTLALAFAYVCWTSEGDEAPVIGSALAAVFIVLGLLPLAVRRHYALNVYPDRIELVNGLRRNKVTILSSHHLQSAGVHQGPLATRLNYGRVTIVTRKGKDVPGGLFDDPEAVAAAIRAIIPT